MEKFIPLHVLDFVRDTLGYAISIFTIMNPLSAGAILLTLVDDKTDRQEFSLIARRTSRAVLAAMIIIFLSGTYIFQFFGISSDSLRMFGGIILLFMGINMVQGRDKAINHSTQENQSAQEKNDISIVPLAIPIIVGPGLATTLATFSVEATTWTENSQVVLAIILCSIGSFIVLKRMPFIKVRLGTNGLKIFNRLMGLIVGALAVQMIVSGAGALFRTYFS